MYVDWIRVVHYRI